MAEQTFRSPGFFEREIDLTQRTVEIEGVPAGIIGTATQGPAFVPVTLGSFVDFERKFGTLNREQFGPFAVREWLKNRTAVTYIRVLGAGAANSTGDIQTTLSQGTVKNAGFRIKGTVAGSSALDALGRHQGSVQFIAASHDANVLEVAGYPLLTDSDSVDTSSSVRLVRAMILMASGARMQILDHDQTYTAANASDDLAKINSYGGTKLDGTFKLVVSSAIGTNFGNDDSLPGIRVYTASLNPTSDYYISKFLNKNPDNFQEDQHLLYGDFSVEDELARVTHNASKGTVAIVSGSAGTSTNSGDTGQSFRDMFGRFDTRYKAAKTTSFISQPFGTKEYDLFHFEALDDGEIGNKRVKISISNIRRSTNKRSKFGTFTVLVRHYDDTDTNLKILEQFPLCTLDPKDENYVANKIGDMKVFYNFDASTDSERRLNVEGKRPNRSQYVRIIMNRAVEDGLVPEETLPFGFRGLPVLKTTDGFTDDDVPLPGGALGSRLTLIEGAQANTDQGSAAVAGESLSGSILPPVPFRYKATRGAVEKDSTPSFAGAPGALELADNRFFWGVKTERLPLTGTIGDAVLQANASSIKNPLVESYSKFLGIQKLDALVTGSGADVFNNNKFSLSKVALYSQIATTSTIEASIATVITGTASEHMREAAYIRNGKIETKNYTILDDGTVGRQRVTLATLAAARNAKYFNRFTDYAKFTNIMYGGFDGLNILDKDNRLMNDRASSVEALGKANVSNGTFTHQNLHADANAGTGKNNNIINSYRTAAKIMTDPLSTRVNIVAIPGIRDSFVTDFVSDLTRDYSKAIYLMDIPSYSDVDANGNSTRIYSKTVRPNVQETIDVFEARAVDNSYVATYFPDMIFSDDINNTAISMPSSVAALKALGYNDSVAYPWFAPAGFNRGALENVLNSEVRLNAEDRNILYEARINPIANFPNGGFVIFGQKTLQQNRSALDRVNVRRMLLEVKRIVSDIANKLIFEQNTPQTRARFVAEVTPQLATIQVQQGVDQFKVIMDSSNNSNEDIEQNRLNGRIVLVPTRAVEFVAIDFIITNSGVSFE